MAALNLSSTNVKLKCVKQSVHQFNVLADRQTDRQNVTYNCLLVEFPILLSVNDYLIF